MANLYLMEMSSTLNDNNLLALMIEHMTKVLNISEGRHGLGYRYLLNHVFEYYGVQIRGEIAGTIKQALSHTTLIECECGELKDGTRNSPLSDLIDQKEALKGQVGTGDEPGSAELIKLKEENAK